MLSVVMLSVVMLSVVILVRSLTLQFTNLVQFYFHGRSSLDKALCRINTGREAERERERERERRKDRETGTEKD